PGRLVAGDQLALLGRADAREDARLELVVLAADAEDDPAPEHRVDLLLIVVRLIMLGVVREVRGQVDHREPEGGDTETRPGAPETAAEDRLEVLDPLDGHVWHSLIPLPMRRPGMTPPVSSR